jgi:hypothetical protein
VVQSVIDHGLYAIQVLSLILVEVSGLLRVELSSAAALPRSKHFEAA